MEKQTPRDLRKKNQQLLLKLIYFNEPISRLELASRSGLSPATVTNLVVPMIDQKLIEQAGIQESQGGRPREILRLNRDYGFFVGVEVAETHIHVQLYDVKLNSLAGVHYELSQDENDPETITGYIEKGVRAVQAAKGLEDADIIAGGIGLPGIVNPVGGVSVFAPNWGWHDVPLRNILQSRLNIRFEIDNGRQAFTLAESMFGAGRGESELAVILIGTGVGAGIITRNQLLRGVSNSAGEWGHTCLDIQGPPCHCGSRGCVETFVGAPGIIRHLREIDPSSPYLDSPSQITIVTMLTEAALAGEPIATRVLDNVTLYLGAGIANLINLVNPAKIVIGGWCGSKLNPYMLPQLKNVVRQFALAEPARAVEYRASELEQQYVTLGAACLALDTFLTGHFFPSDSAFAV